MASIWKTKHVTALLGAGCGAAVPFFAPVVMADDDKKSSGQIRPSQLPIYEDPEDLFEISYEVSGKGQLQEGVEVIRKELCGAVSATKEFRDEATRIYETGKAHTAGQIAYLREDENVAARSGAIAVGGVLGLMLGARGRFFKKLLYTSAGAAGTAAVLYPQYSRQYTQEAMDVANSYSTVAYNFLFGVKPQTTKDDSGDTGAAAPSTPGPKVEVSNLYPSLLTLPHSRLFTKKEEKNYWPYVKVVKEGPVLTQEKSLEQIAEEASQVSTLGFRLQESHAVQGFASVAEPVVVEENNSVPSTSVENEEISLAKKENEESFLTKEQNEKPSISKQEKSAVGPQSQEPPSTLPLTSEDIEKGSDKKFIDNLIDKTEKVVEFAEKVEKDAQLVEKVAEKVETISEVIPVIGEEIESVAEFVKEAAAVVEEVADDVKQVAEKVEVLEVAEAKRESVSTSQSVTPENQVESEKKTSLFKKVSNFFSTPDATESVTSNLTVSPSPAAEPVLRTDSSSSDVRNEKPENSLSGTGTRDAGELTITEPILEKDASAGKDRTTEPSDSTLIKADETIKSSNENSVFDEQSQTLSGNSDLRTIEQSTQSTSTDEKEIDPLKEGLPTAQNDSKDNVDPIKTSQAVPQATELQELSKPVKSEVSTIIKSEEKPSLLSKISDFFSTDSSKTGKSPDAGLKDNSVEKAEEPVESSSDFANNEGTRAPDSSAPAVGVVQKPQIPESLKSKVAVASKQDSSSSRDESKLSVDDEPKLEALDSTQPEVQKSSGAPKPSDIQKPSETPKPSDAQKPSETPKPSDIQKPSETPKPSDIQKPSVTPKSSDVQKPSETPKSSDVQNPSETPKSSDVQKPSETPKLSDVQKPSETPKSSDVQKPSETPKSSDVPKPFETPKPSETQTPSDTQKPTDSLVKEAPPNPNVVEICDPETRPKSPEKLTRVRDEGGLMIIESPGVENLCPVLEEGPETEMKASPSEAKTPAEDHGQSNPSDADMYTTRS